jgi:transposase InsO family protein
MNERQIADLIWKVEVYKGRRSEVLAELGIPRSTYYKWRKVFREKGHKGLKRSSSARRRIWNRLLPEERDTVLEIAKGHPELSSRLLAVKITDEEEFSVSESTVYRILKENNLVAPRPLNDMPAAKEWRHKTRKPDELWQCDATNFFVVGWGYYKLIPVLDDLSRKIIAHDLRPDETAYSIADTVELAIEKAKAEGHLRGGWMPKLYSDNGSGFTSKLMDAYLTTRGIKHILGTPYHPQGRGKIERFNRRIKEKLCLVVYCSPDVLKKAIDEAIDLYNNTPHEALDNVSPNDVYAGRKEAILQKRREKKRLTLERRKKYNLQHINHSPNYRHSAKYPDL